MLPSRGITLTGHGLKYLRPTPPRLQATRQAIIPQSRPLKLPLTTATVGRANISLWPWGSRKEGLGFSISTPATREGTPDAPGPSSVSASSGSSSVSASSEPSSVSANSGPSSVSANSGPSSVSASSSEPVASTKDAAVSASSTPQSPEPSNAVESTMDPTPIPLESADDSILAAIQTPLITEDHFGFLREMGLNYGFPYITNTLEIIMESIHVYAGTEWWATIALSAIAVRLLMTVPMAIGSHHLAKLELIKPYTMAANEKLSKAKESHDPLAIQEAQKEVAELMKTAGLKVFWPMAPTLLQALFGFCAFKLMRAMTALPVPGLETGGALWFLDLTVRDPNFILPVVMGGVLHLVGRMGGEIASQGQLSDGMRNSMLYYLPVVMTCIVAFQPAALQISFLTAMIWGVGQGYLFKQAWFRKFFHMEPLPNKIPQSQLSGPTKARANIHQAGIAPPASAKPARKLRTVSPTLKYEAPRAQPQRKMAVSSPPKEAKTKTPVAPSKNLMQTVLTDASNARDKVTGLFNNTLGSSASTSPEKKRSEEYERRRREEKKFEAEIRRQGRH
ncbi:Homoisocitrate dehydrogenase [Venturia nashicola]|nr:Homoisocitrate dehydrogenase [Venturia nashicola]